MEIREDHYRLDQIQTVGDVLHRGAAIAIDEEHYRNLQRPMLIELLTEAAYPHGNVPGSGLVGIRSDPQYAEHMRIRRMDLEVQTFLKADCGYNLFRDARLDRQLAGQMLESAARAWDIRRVA